eukprot:TCONS_00016793-protein
MELRCTLFQCFYVLLTLQETFTLYLPSRYRRFPLRHLVHPSVNMVDELYESTLEYYGSDRRTHTVSRDEKQTGENFLRDTLSKNKVEKNTLTFTSLSTASTKKTTTTTTTSKLDVRQTQTNQHHRVAKDTDIVIASLIVRDSDGKEHKKFVVMKNKKRHIVRQPKPRTKVHAWWG